MNKNNMPRTPFSTPLSGSAREVELRLKNIFSGPKKRPPALFLALVFAMCLFCGNLVSCQVKGAAPEAEAWVDYSSTGEMPWDESAGIELPEYPGVTFRWTPYGVTAGDETGETALIGGMPVWNVFLCDLNGDGKRELCATVSFGSGIIDDHIEVYDYAAGQRYLLWDRGEYDYTLSLEDGQLQVSQWEYLGGYPDQGEPVSVGRLALSADDSREEDGTWFIAWPGSMSPSEQEEPEYLPASELSFDLNQNGIPEEVRLESEYGRDEVRFYEDGELIGWEQPGVCIYSYPLGGPDHILRYYDYSDYPGAYSYSYHISDFSGEFEEVIQFNSVSFDLNFNAPFHTGFDPAAIAAYAEELNELYDHCWRLSVVDGELVAEKPELTLPWLDAYPEIFTRDPDKSLEENLRDFQTAMTAAYPAPEPLGELDALPFDQTLEMIFLSGAGAWCTGLDLNPDGTFTADYHDSDGPIQYVCQFHGKLGDFVQLTEHSWSLTLKELVLDTKYPVGKEWDEGGFHKISSQPNGFTDGDGNALKPGARFILYSPQARGDKPGAELYGAQSLWDWCLLRPDISGGEPLGCWDLYNPASGIGFFTDD